MFIYWCLFFIVTINTFVGHFIKNKYINSICLFISFFAMFILSALRKEIGADYYNYLVFFEKYSRDIKIERDVEIGYEIINKICVELGLGFNGVIVITSFLSCFPVYFLSQKINKPLLFYAYFLLYYAMSYCVIRQCIGTAIAVVATYYFIEQFYQSDLDILVSNLKIKKEKHYSISIKVLLLAVLACLFHKIMIAYFVVLFIAPLLKLYNPKKVVPIAFAAIMVGIIGTPIINFLTNHFSEGSYSRYFTSGSSNVTIVREIGSGLGIILRYFIYVVSFITISYVLRKRSDKEKAIFYTLFIMMIGFDAFSIKSRVFLRFKYLFWVSYLIPFYFYKKMSGKNETVLFIQLFGALAIIGYAVAFRYRSEFNINGDIPYTAYLSLAFFK